MRRRTCAVMTLGAALLTLPPAALAQGDATLTGLAPSAGTLSPAFSSGTFSYTVSVAYAISEITVTPTAADTNATITVNGTNVASGSASGDIALNVGSNAITTVVISQDLSGTNTYLLTVTRVAGHIWTQTAGGAQSWTTDTNWFGGVAPSPVSGDTVDFSTVNIAANTTLTLGADRTAELWKFGDSSGGQTWTVNAGNAMILAGTMPTISNSVQLTLNSVVDGAGPLTKAGAGAITLGGVNTYSGGTIITGPGQVTINAESGFGSTGTPVTVNSSVTLLSGNNFTINRDFALNNNAILSYDIGGNNGDYTISGAVTGSGGIRVTETLGLKLTSTNSTFTGPITMGGSIYGGRIYVNSIGDAPGAGTIQVGSPSGYGGGIFQWDTGAVTPLTLNYRTIDVAAPGGSASVINNSGTATNIITINTDLTSASTTAGARTLVLSGSNTGSNLVAGRIVNGGANTVSVSKQGNGLWVVSASNSYSGGTTVSAGTLKAGGSGSLGAGSVTVTAGTLVIDAADAIADTAELRLPSASTKNITMNASDTVGSLYLGGVRQPNGTYSSTGAGTNWMNAGSGILSVGPAASQPLYWDLDGATAGAGGATPAGTWDAAGTNWSAASDGTGTAAAWTAGATATFAAGINASGDYTVTVDGTQDLGGLTFEEGAVTVTGGIALRLVSDSVVFVNAGLTATLATPLTQDDTDRALTKSGTGTLSLIASNSYSGATTVGSGTLQLDHTDAIRSSSGLVVQGGTAIVNASVSLKSLFFDTGVARSVAGSGALNFAPGGTIWNTDNRIDCTISTPITGSPAVNIKDSGANNTYLGLRFAPTNGTQTLGAVLNPDNTGTSDKAGITLAGSTTSNSVASIDYAGGDRYADVKVQSGEWTVGSIRTGTIRLTGGTLILNGTMTTMYQGLQPILSGAKLTGAFNYFMNDSRFGPFTVNGGGFVAPGNPAVNHGVGTGSIAFNTGQSATGATVFSAGSIYEWQVGPANATDTIYVMRSATVSNNSRSLTIQAGMILKILDAGGTPLATDRLTVFTYDSGVTRSLGAVTFDLSALGSDWHAVDLALTDDGAGTIYLTGLSKGYSGAVMIVR